ncbi:hypothetical protein NDU88_004813 [Pleurodeles waltl]|uniref:Uncharacterized protein n=1 Tax=Pleurodeles waltl TaxID=8319 RepID=A0AAV7NKN1_PLEWA|nr:hypothetical protein NDU88_004813 [Pleurodeles waltl]
MARSATHRFHRLRGHSWALGPPPEPAPPRGDPSGVPRRSTPSALTPLRASAQREAAASAALSGLRARAQQRAGFAPRHSPWSPRGSAPSWPLPPAQSLRTDLGRPGEGTISSTFSPAPPEREVQACAISGSLATPKCEIL